MIGKICRIKGCKNILKKVDGRICRVHRSRWFRHKDYNISPKWTLLKKGQPSLTPLGYMRIFINGKRVLQHRYVMEQYLGRKLTKDEKIHHINNIKTDNRIENLELITQSKHMINYHQKKSIIDWSKYSIPKHNIKGICLIQECKNKTRARGLCEKHFQSFYKNFIRA